ncbi:TraB/GumN family protein [Cognatilysobacter bugurensis]|uniref:TraB/GumN family protein n=1 Tax=Cognatilysobacter bugurensis TaxID=543356 RepID=A0A918SWG9_9GAMM|nr:TraB/GumN family protein [Lysobacter bugurensis]GHA70846.1 TraB/GumN family protein [Lysobacter bugurensis]
MPVLRFIAAAALGLVLTAASAVRADEASARRTSPAPLLWQVSDADSTVYLLGSFHLLKPDDYPLPREVEAAFVDAERLVFEISPEELARPDVAQQTLAAARYADGSTLSAVLPGPLREKFEALLAERGATLAQYDGFEPWFVNLTLVMGLSNTLGFSAEHGLDQHLMRKAATAGKPALGLETVSAQMQALDSTPLDEQLAALEDFVDDPDGTRALLTRLHDAWRRGDADELDRLTRSEMQRETPETYRIVNVERNRAWMPAIRAQLADPRDDVLVVVGAMHLLGDDGLVEQLRAQGLRVERVCETCNSVRGR